MPDGCSVRDVAPSLLNNIGRQHLDWKERNSRTFNNITCSSAEVLRAIVDEANLWMLAGFKQLHSLAVFANLSHFCFHVN
jgi:hypothetical protein